MLLDIWAVHGKVCTRRVVHRFGRITSLAFNLVRLGTWAALKCKYFARLTTKKGCRNSDLLERAGLQHQDACPLCDQEDKTISHLSQAVRSPDKSVEGLRVFHLQAIASQPDDNFNTWLENAATRAGPDKTKGACSLIILN